MQPLWIVYLVQMLLGLDGTLFAFCSADYPRERRKRAANPVASVFTTGTEAVTCIRTEDLVVSLFGADNIAR
jgi:hypothetical protein